MWQDRSGQKRSALRISLKGSLVILLLLLVGSANGGEYVSAGQAVEIPAFPGRHFLGLKDMERDR